MKITRLSLYAFFAVFLLVVSCGKDGGETDPNTKPTSKTQAQRVKDLQNSILLGISISDLKKEGYTLEEFLLAEVSVEDILTAGFTLGELLEEDEITIAELKSNGITLQQLFDADVPVADLWKADYSVNELLAIEGIDIAGLKAANVPLQDIMDAGQSVQSVLAGGFTVSDLKSSEVPVKSVYDAGVTLENMMSGGYTMEELLSLDEVTLQAFIENDYTLEDFIEEGVSAEDLKGAGFSVLEMYEADMPLEDIFRLGVGVGTLRGFGATENALKAAGLVGSVNDIDNNNYGWVKIGDQIWMSESLRTTRDRDGNGLQSFTYKDSVELKDTYGRIYQNAIISSNLCPTGWKIPSSSDFETLLAFLGPEAVIKLKDNDTDYWKEGKSGTNESGFSAKGGGWFTGSEYREFGEIINYAGEKYSPQTTSIWILNIGENVQTFAHGPQYYSYIRCIKE